MKALVDRIRAKIRGVRVIGATVTTSRGSSIPGYGGVDTDNRRHALNELVRKPGLFDGVIDFDGVTADPQTGELRAGVRAGLHDRRGGRQAAPEPRRIPGHGRRGGPARPGAAYPTATSPPARPAAPGGACRRA